MQERRLILDQQRPFRVLKKVPSHFGKSWSFMKTNLSPPRLYVPYINQVLSLESKYSPVAVANNLFPNFSSNLEIVLGEGSLAQCTGEGLSFMSLLTR